MIDVNRRMATTCKGNYVHVIYSGHLISDNEQFKWTLCVESSMALYDQ